MKQTPVDRGSTLIIC
jgi:hypothetical protein